MPSYFEGQGQWLKRGTLPPCCVLTASLCRKDQWSQQWEMQLFLQRVEEIQSWSRQAPQAQKSCSDHKPFFPDCLALKHSKKKHFVTKNRNYTTTSQLQTSPQGHTNDSRLTRARADTILSLKAVLSIPVPGCWLSKSTDSWRLPGGYERASAPRMLLSHTSRLRHSSFSSLPCS